MGVKMGVGVSGYYEVDVIRNKGLAGEYTEHCGRSDNLILNGFFSRWQAGQMSGTGWRFFVGSGTTPPLVTNNQLQAQIGGASGSASVAEDGNVKVGDDYFCSRTGTGSWPVGAIVGNISEVGCGLRSATAANALDSRALIVDEQGNPTTITVTELDQLVVRYTIRFKIPVTPHVSVVNFEGVPTTCTLESVGVLDSERWSAAMILTGFMPRTGGLLSSTQGVIGDPESTPSFGPSYAGGLVGRTAIGSNGLRRSLTFRTSEGNALAPGGIKYLGLPIAGSQTVFFQGIHFDPPLMKNNEKSLVLNFDYTLVRV